MHLVCFVLLFNLNLWLAAHHTTTYVNCLFFLFYFLNSVNAVKLPACVLFSEQLILEGYTVLAQLSLPYTGQMHLCSKLGEGLPFGK